MTEQLSGRAHVFVDATPHRGLPVVAAAAPVEPAAAPESEPSGAHPADLSSPPVVTGWAPTAWRARFGR